MSGGLSYHFTALRHRKLWRPFLKRVDQWLTSWITPENELIIFGASGGWTIPANFLQRFERIIIVEPDPSARAILRLRFPLVENWVMHADTALLPWFQNVPSQADRRLRTPAQSDLDLAAPAFHQNSDRLGVFLAKYPKAAILFSNLLGQVPLIWPNELTPTEWEACNGRFLGALVGRNWASYHDLLSGNCIPSLSTNEAPVWHENESLNQVGARVWADPNKNAVISDHGMDWLGASELTLWHLRPETYHLIGFFTSRS